MKVKFAIGLTCNPGYRFAIFERRRSTSKSMGQLLATKYLLSQIQRSLSSNLFGYFGVNGLIHLLQLC
jgi:hypothetical protein